MFGFFIGTACLIGLAAVARRGHRYYHGHGACHRGGFGRRWGGGRFFFHRILDRLDTTPGQEKVIREAVHDFKEEAWNLRREVRSTRSELADALRAPELDKALIDRVFAKHDEVIEKLRASLVATADKVHGTLDERQRKELADMIESGPFGYAGC
jgi:Spy/CpxP family protein refolding chaperone